MKIKCLIVDDEQYARKLIAGYINKIPELELAGECKNSMEAIASLRNEQIDLMFLDIQMPDLTGVDLLKTLTTKPVVIFTTAYKEHALEGYELDVIDYMMKPIAFERFVQGVNKAMDFIRMKIQSNPTELVRNKTNTDDNTLIIKADYKFYRIKYSDILYIEGLKEYVTFYTVQRKYVVHESLKHLEEILPLSRFMRIHKSYIINKDKVDSMYGNIIEIKDTEIPIGKSYADEAKKSLFGIA